MAELPKVPATPAEGRAQIEAALLSLKKTETESAGAFFEGIKGLMLLSESLRKEGADLGRIKTQGDQIKQLAGRSDLSEPAKRLAGTLASENDAIVAIGAQFDRAAQDLDGVIQKLRELRRSEMDRARDYLVHSAELLPLLPSPKKEH